MSTEPQKPTSPDAASPANERDILTSHEYDGIREYDNPIPTWWNWIFVATTIYSAIYFFFVVVADGVLSPRAEYDRAVVEQLKAQFAGGNIKGDAATLVRLSKDQSMLSMGAGIFATNCVSCHNRDGSGMPNLGPNLTDDFYINVKNIEDIVSIVTKGKPPLMPTWSPKLNANDIVLVSAYVASLRGQNKPGKSVEPNAVQILPWSEISTASSTAAPTTTAAAAVDDDPTKQPQTLKTDAASMLGYMKDPTFMASANTVYNTYCAACHAPDGSGLLNLGPNMTDDFYINIKKLEDIVPFVRAGKQVEPTPMPVWSQLMAPDDLIRASVYIASLRGGNKPGRPVDPNALKITPWSAQ